MDAPGPRLESILGHCERHALLPKWFDHWTTWAGPTHTDKYRHSQTQTEMMSHCYFSSLMFLFYYYRSISLTEPAEDNE